MKTLYYLIVVEQGVEAFARGPFKTDEQRNNEAKQIHQTQEEDDGLFWADVDKSGRLTVGPYVAGFFFQELTDSSD
ncbi:MAG: hypothetical protein HY203_04520 [Nitrospirae bacterium]|nr:hypothetical protein [Nitrospirota bacterium]